MNTAHAGVAFRETELCGDTAWIIWKASSPATSEEREPQSA